MRALTLFCALVGALQSGSSETWSGVPRGPHPVGFRVAPPEGGPPSAGERVFVWRPIRHAAPAMTLGELVRLTCPASEGLRDCFPDLANGTGAVKPTVADLDRLGRQKLEASTGGIPVDAPLPLVVLVGSIASRGGEFIALAEVLASRGYVAAVVVPPAVASTPTLSAAARRIASEGLSRVIARLGRDPGVRRTHLGLVGWSFGGVPAALEAMNNPLVRGFVSFDSAIRYRYGADLIRQAPAYRPLEYRGRVLSIAAGIDNTVPKDDTVLRALTNTSLESEVAAGLRHADFSDQYGALPASLGVNNGATLFRRDFASVLTRVVSFFDQVMQ